MNAMDEYFTSLKAIADSAAEKAKYISEIADRALALIPIYEALGAPSRAHYQSVIDLKRAALEDYQHSIQIVEKIYAYYENYLPANVIEMEMPDFD